MSHVTPQDASEAEFAALVEKLASERRTSELLDLLREEHAIYTQRGSTTVARMRGWILLALARVGVNDAALAFVLEELDTGLEAYPVAAAACALRAYPQRSGAFAPYLLQALTNIDGHDEPLSLDAHGGYDGRAVTTTATQEILACLRWLGPAARTILPELDTIRNGRVIPRRVLPEFDEALCAIRSAGATDESSCCALPEELRRLFSRTGSGDGDDIGAIRLEDHAGEQLTFQGFFSGQPTIVVFFYTRCDNPLKCSLTITKLGRVQTMLEERGLHDRVRTAAITYDPGFDSAQRMRSFGSRRGLRLGANHRMLRAIAGMAPLERYFGLGVNFIESLVNRHRIEAYVLDDRGRIVCSFERLRWDETEVVERAIAVLRDCETQQLPQPPQTERTESSRSALLTALPSLALACLPKCPICWAMYVSAVGIAGLDRVATLSWIQPVLVAAVLINIAGAWLRSRVTGSFAGALLVSAGALAILGMPLSPSAGALGVGLTFVGSVLSAFDSRTSGRVETPVSARV